MTTDTPGRCPACGARLAPGADWCSLCLSPVSTTPTDGAVAPGEPAGAADGGGPPTTDGTDQPDAADGADQPDGADGAERMLARLRAESAQQRPLGGGPLAGASRGALLGLGVLLALGTSAVVVGLLWLVGLAL